MRYEHPNVAVLGSVVEVVLQQNFESKPNQSVDSFIQGYPLLTDGSAYQCDE